MRMQDYVRYSPNKLGDNLQKRDELVSQVSYIFQKSNCQSITLIASGSSYNSLAMVQDALQEMMQMPINLYTPEHVLEFGFVDFRKTLIFIVSQSGSSTNIIKCLKYMKENNISAISLTGNVDSQMAKYSQVIFNYGPGNEYVDYVTTGVQTLIEFFLLWGCQNSSLTNKQKTEFYMEFKETISYEEELIKETDKFISQNRFAFSEKKPTFFCGNGPNFGVAKEGALKFQETLKRPAMYYELEEFLHGPDMQLTPDYTVFLLDDMAIKSKSRFTEVFSALKGITPNVFLITSSSELKGDKRILKTKEVPNWILSPYYSLPVVQLIAAVMTDELNTWDVHPYFDKFDQKIAIKTSDYDEEISDIKKKWESNQKIK